MIGQGQSKNLRWRLMLGCLTPLVISLVLQASYTMAQQRREMMQGLGDKASSLAHLLVNVVGPSMMVDDPKAVDEGLDYVAGDPDFGFAVALDVRGGVIAYRGPGLRRAELSQNTRPVNLPQLTSASEFLVSAFPVESGGRNMGSVHIGLQTTTVRQRVASMAVRAAIISVAGIAIAVLVVSVLATTIVHRNRDMQLLLDSMTEGLVTSSLSGEVKGHRSRTITRWFGQPAPGTRLWNYLAADDRQFAAFFELAFQQLASEELLFEMAAEQLPKQLMRGGKIFELEFRPVHEGGHLRAILTVVRDVTAQTEAMRAERLAREEQKVIANLLRDKRGFRQTVAECERLLEDIASSPDKNQLRHAVHTLKGNCAVYGFARVAERAHALESQLDGEGTIGHDDVRSLEAEWRDSFRRIEEFVIHARDRLEVEERQVTLLIQSLRARADYEEILAMVEAWRLEPTSASLYRLGAQARRIAEQLGKSIDVRVEDHRLRLASDRFQPFWAGLVHAVRNAVDHGIEPTAIRRAGGKPEAGSIVLCTSLDKERLVVSVGDDGGGVDFDAIRERARALGLPHDTRDQLVDTLFADGVSTSELVTEVSGRGIGMGALREQCRALGGSIEVESERGVGTTFRFLIPMDSATMATLRKASA